MQFNKDHVMQLGPNAVAHSSLWYDNINCCRALQTDDTAMANSSDEGNEMHLITATKQHITVINMYNSMDICTTTILSTQPISIFINNFTLNNIIYEKL